MVFALPVHKYGAALVPRARRQYITSQRSARAAREFFSVPQISGKQLHFFKVVVHIFSLLLAVHSRARQSIYTIYGFERDLMCGVGWWRPCAARIAESFPIIRASVLGRL